MSKTRVGLVGLGRIGRNLFRLLDGHAGLELVAVVDRADGEALAYLLTFDSILGRAREPVRLEDGLLVAGSRRVRLAAPPKEGSPPWGEWGVEVVVDATERPRRRKDVEGDLAAGAGRVVLCSPVVGAPDRTIIVGLNDPELVAADRIVSNASVTAHAAAHVLRILDEQFGIERGFLTAVHAYSTNLHLADVPAADMRSGRAAAENIIPQPSSAADVVAGLLPGLSGRLSGLALNVPVPNGSAVDLTCWHQRPATVDAIRDAVRSEAEGRLRGILAFETAPIVSIDVLGGTVSGTFDAESTMMIGDRVSKTLTWFDNGWGYTHRLVELLGRVASLAGAERA